jgi:hypothetical protein
MDITTAQAVAERIAAGGSFRRPRINEALVAEAASLWGRAWNGNRFAQLAVMEALSTSDFKYATWTVLDRELLDRYNDLPPTWQQYARRTTVRDFKKKRLIDLLGGRASLEAVPEATEFPAGSVDTQYYEIGVGKYGKRFQFTWEAQVNDDIDQLRELPGDLAIAARDTESKTVAALLTDGDSYNGAIFNSTAWGRTQDASGTWSGGSSNLLASNPALTYDNLLAALDAISYRLDPEGRPIFVKAFKLVIPPQLETTADKILQATEYRDTSGNQLRITSNLLNGRVTKVVEPWLNVLDTGSNKATSWYLVPDPQVGRPALFAAFLRGYETPDLRVKADTGQRVGGGDIPGTEGSFDEDDIQFRVRHVVGAASADMIATAASNGSGS